MKTLTLVAGLLALFILLVSGPLYQLEILSLGHAFLGMRIAVITGGIALVLALIQIIFMHKSISWPKTGVAVICAAIAVAMPLSLMMKAKSVPAIHDITTDVVNPPKFVAILPLRADAPNPAEYQGEEIAKQQLSAYPELQTQTFAYPADKVFAAALTTLGAMGLEVIAVEENEGRIEAVDTTRWFGFKDDLVIRIQSEGQITLFDARSKSRVGRSDVGKNAERLTELINKVQARLSA
ncbi:DUF1499 domain-containing protein [Paraglaciecola aestuariivivens]